MDRRSLSIGHQNEGQNLKRLAGTILSISLLSVAIAQSSQATPESGSTTSQSATGQTQTITIMRSGLRASTRGPVECFTGSVRADALSPVNDPSQTSGGDVTFEPGARSAWHTHPLGQVLIVTSGLGRVQRWGGPIEDIRPGDVVWIPPGVKH